MQIQSHAGHSETSLRSKSGANRRTIPVLEGGLPVLGFALEFQRNPVSLLERGYAEHGSLFAFPLASHELVVFGGPSAQASFFAASEEHLSAHDVYEFTVPIFGKGIAYDTPRQLRHQHIAFLHPALRESRMEIYADIMREEARAYFSHWGEKGEVSLPSMMSELTLNIASRCLLGNEIRQRLGDGFSEHYRGLHGGINTLGFFMPQMPSPAQRKREKARREVANRIAKVICQRRAEKVSTSNECLPEDFMQTLLDARYEDGGELGENEIVRILLATLFGGQHSSAALSTWLGVELLQHPAYMKRIREELKTTSMSSTALKEQVVLERAVRECERLHPPLIMLLRRVMKPFDYDGMTVPVGKIAMVSPALAHGLEEVFPNPRCFDPDRFDEPRSEHKRQPCSLIGFGGGRHRCLGVHFATMQIKLIWSTLLEAFDLELASPVPQADYRRWVSGPTQPCRIRYRRRQHECAPRR